VILRRTRFELRKAEERAEALKVISLLSPTSNEFLRIIRGSANRDEARSETARIRFTKRQVEQIGILIRNPARLTNWPLRVQRSSRPTKFLTSACIS